MCTESLAHSIDFATRVQAGVVKVNRASSRPRPARAGRRNQGLVVEHHP
ncbi:hypothetical protein [Spelaeicoccus albus]|nr:hypothetical protein [Spelaeicoccus albus]